MILEVINWDAFNPRKDLKSMPWFRLQSDIGYSETLFGLDAQAKWLWVFILSTCARKMSSEIRVELSYAAHHSGIKEKLVENYIQLFEKRGLVRVTNESDRIRTDQIENVPNRTEQNEQNEQDRTPATTKSRTVGSLQEFSKCKDMENFLSGVKHDAQNLWIKTYGDVSWLQTEIYKAMSWITANPTRKPKGNPTRFLNNWFSRGWESYRKTLTSKKASDLENLELN